MREIKYKARRIDNGEWVKGHLYYFDPNRSRELHMQWYDEKNYLYLSCEIDPETVCEFTGAKDWYEHDLFKDNTGRIMEIVWDDHFCGFKFALDTDDNDLQRYLPVCGLCAVERIGNIHDEEEEG